MRFKKLSSAILTFFLTASLLACEPSFEASLVSDPLLHPGGTSTKNINDWGIKLRLDRVSIKRASCSGNQRTRLIG
ncbi:hypothetical protein [Cytobacillus firmus]|uniref:hypothetical protein n=1 Tax=Cytobacillus firmus TaxID=1399 RepID=UPI0018CF4DBD|nr:hypothetical protein [Cytobacillus firmus]MBG9549169.1 hypothetical protein [Cytobacillus firmus]MBG9605450.1 hypothetical protein [Cytobacillus firmus]MED1942559.1 hypothetical protein [Cytobacillus firmus]